MIKNTGENNEIMIDPMAIAHRYQAFIKGTVNRVYSLPVGSLNFDPKESFLDLENPNTVFCYVYDSEGSPYGVVIELEDGEPSRYRCQKIKF